ncbi:unnamed protein product, partial [Ectocarpus sp. 13 AM-2016]
CLTCCCCHACCVCGYLGSAGCPRPGARHEGKRVIVTGLRGATVFFCGSGGAVIVVGCCRYLGCEKRGPLGIFFPVRHICARS